MVDTQRIAQLAELWESLQFLSLARRINEFVKARRARGEKDAYARPAHYAAEAQTGSAAAAATYILELDRKVGAFVAHTIQTPDTANDVTITKISKNGRNHVDADVLGEGFLSSEADLNEDRQLPHPLVLDVGGRVTIEATGTALSTSRLQVHGFQVDDMTARVLEEVGELWVEGITATMAAATLMMKTIPRSMRSKKRQTHLLARETLTGDAVRSNISILLKGERILPREGACLPPRSPLKGGALCEIDYENNDSVILDTRYTSAAGTGTASLKLTLMGRRRFLDAC